MQVEHTADCFGGACLRAENERSHVATETGMLKQDFSAINVSLNNSWVTGGIEIEFWL